MRSAPLRTDPSKPKPLSFQLPTPLASELRRFHRSRPAPFRAASPISTAPAALRSRVPPAYPPRLTAIAALSRFLGSAIVPPHAPRNRTSRSLHCGPCRLSPTAARAAHSRHIYTVCPTRACSPFQHLPGSAGPRNPVPPFHSKRAIPEHPSSRSPIPLRPGRPHVPRPRARPSGCATSNCPPARYGLDPTSAWIPASLSAIDAPPDTRPAANPWPPKQTEYESAIRYPPVPLLFVGCQQDETGNAPGLLSPLPRRLSAPGAMPQASPNPSAPGGAATDLTVPAGKPVPRIPSHRSKQAR